MNTTQPLILASLIRGPGNPLEVIERIRQSTGRELSLAGIYTQLNRLEKDGLLKSKMGDASSATKSGRRHRFYTITGEGLNRMREIELARGGGVPCLIKKM